MPFTRTEQGRVHVERAAGDHQPVDQFEVVPGLVGLVGQGQRQPTRRGHGVGVVLA